MNLKNRNIILIGMPGSGKSTIGVVLAKSLGYNFIDSDIVIQEKLGRRLWEVIDSVGKDEFNRLEGEINCDIDPELAVISTGGSAIYSEKAMKHFKNIGTVVFLDVDLKIIKRRLGDLKRRGISMKDIYRERINLYRKYADIIFKPQAFSIKDNVEAIKALF